LFIGGKWDTDSNDIVWEENFKGFSFREDFSRWDFDLLDREITLSKAQKDSEEKSDGGSEKE